jgi:hypothetical protein
MQRRPLLFVLGLAVVAAAGVGRSQTPAAQGPPGPPRPGAGRIAGRVTDAGSHAPLPGTVVALNGRGAPPQARVITDSSGQFAFHDLPAGVFTVLATHSGYSGGGDGREASGPGRLVELALDQTIDDLTLSLWKLGAISGTVVADGDPLVGVEVVALRRSLVSSRWRYVNVATTGTDDRGRYRLSGLMPGEYLVAVRPDRDPETPLLLTLLASSPAASVDVLAAATAKGRGVPERDARVRTYATTFFRGVPGSATATRVAIDASADRSGVDFQLKPARGVRVTGAVTGLDAPAEEMEVHLERADSSLEVDPLDVAAAALESDGRFEFTGVPPGKYIVTMLARPAGPPGPPPPAPPPPAPPPLPAGPTWWARAAITVAASDLTAVRVPAHRGSIVRGHAEFNGRAAPAAAEIAAINLQLAPDFAPLPGPQGWRGLVAPDGTFQTMSVPPGRYLVRVGNVPRGWTLESATAAGRDALDVPLDVQSSDVDGVVLHFVDRPLGGVSGLVQDSAGAPASNAVVLIFPVAREPGLDTTPQARRFRSVRSLANGSFNTGGLPPGAYLAVALPNPPAPDWQDPQRLAALAPSATRVEVGSGPSAAITLAMLKAQVKK